MDIQTGQVRFCTSNGGIDTDSTSEINFIVVYPPDKFLDNEEFGAIFIFSRIFELQKLRDGIKCWITRGW